MSRIPYASVVRNPRFGRLLPGFAASYLGDGMSAIAISWLALQLAPPGARGLWVALAVAAYTFPGALGTFALAAPLRGRPGAQLVRWNSSLRAVSLGLIAVLGIVGVLSVWSFVALLAVSSVLHAWGSAGAYAMVAELLPPRDHLPANALLGMLAQGGVLLGPPIAGLVIAGRGAAWVVLLDALSFTILALSARVPSAPTSAAAPPSRWAGFRLLAADRRLAALLALTFGFYALYGPFEVGLPVYVADYQHAPASHLAWYFTAFGAGAIVGGLVAGYLRSWPLGPATAGIVIGVGAALLPIGLGAPDRVGVACYGVAGLFFGPYSALITALIQRVCAPSSIAEVLAARGTVLIASGPAGVGLGALLIATVGVRPALLTAAAATLGLGVLAAIASSRWRPRRPRPTPASPVPLPIRPASTSEDRPVVPGQASENLMPRLIMPL